MRERWNRRRQVAVAVGGVAGSGMRWAVLASVESGSFPWPVFAINVVGSVLLGGLLAEESKRPASRMLLHDAGGIGFCGGLTTFSTFSLEVVNLARSGDVTTAVVYAVSSLVAAVVGVVCGAAVVHRTRAAGMPLEEDP